MVAERWEAPYRIHNGSDYPLTNVMLAINDPGREGRPEDQMGTATELVIGTLAAGEVMEDRIAHLHFSLDPVFAGLTHMTVLLFTDRWGNSWATGRGELVRCKYPRGCADASSPDPQRQHHSVPEQLVARILS